MAKTLEGKRILVAEDGPDNQMLLRLYLETAGANVVLVGTGVRAVEEALASPFDLILMDIQMPEMDGLKATRQLREEGFTKPIVALTAHSQIEEKEKSLLAGCDDHLVKPIARTVLISEIQKLLGLS